MTFEHPVLFSLLLLGRLVGQAAPPAQGASPPAPPLGLPPVAWRADNPYSAARVELGRNLFFDPRLSSNGKVSCATRHPPERASAGGDPPARGARSLQIVSWSPRVDSAPLAAFDPPSFPIATKGAWT